MVHCNIFSLKEYCSLGSKFHSTVVTCNSEVQIIKSESIQGPRKDFTKKPGSRSCKMTQGESRARVMTHLAMGLAGSFLADQTKGETRLLDLECKDLYLYD